MQPSQWPGSEQTFATRPCILRGAMERLRHEHFPLANAPDDDGIFQIEQIVPLRSMRLAQDPGGCLLVALVDHGGHGSHEASTL